MTDPEKVIMLLDDMRLFADTRVHQIVSPENWGIYSDSCDFIDLVKEEILALLKEQEPRPIAYTDNPYTGLPVARCPKCGKFARQFHPAITEETHYCPWCGQAVKWN